MAVLKVVDRDGVEHEVEARTGLKVMETLRELDYGVAAICGGMCTGATCHVYVDPAWADKLPPPQSDERELLNELSHFTAQSRRARGGADRRGQELLFRRRSARDERQGQGRGCVHSRADDLSP